MSFVLLIWFVTVSLLHWQVGLQVQYQNQVNLLLKLVVVIIRAHRIEYYSMLVSESILCGTNNVWLVLLMI